MCLNGLLLRDMSKHSENLSELIGVQDDLCFMLLQFCSVLSTIAELSRKMSLTLNAPIATKVVCFSRLLKCLKSIYVKKVDPDQTAPIGAVCSRSTLFASIPTSSVM